MLDLHHLRPKAAPWVNPGHVEAGGKAPIDSDGAKI